MTTKDSIRFTLGLSHHSILKAADAMKHAPLTFPTPAGGCHPLWVLGHLAFVEGFIPSILYGKPNPAADWAPLFGQGTTPVQDAAVYPSFEAVRDRYLQLREANLALLESCSAADLDQPTAAPPKGLENEFATFGQSFLTLAFHQAIHHSHLTDALRALEMAK